MDNSFYNRFAFRHALLAGGLLACVSLGSGCRMGAPVHVWQPPALHSTVGHSVMVPPVVGSADVADKLHQKLVHATPRDAGRKTNLVASEDLKPKPETDSEPHGPLALVSYEEISHSDLALSSAARSEGVDFVLRGEVLPDRQPRPIEDGGKRLSVSWRLMPIGATNEEDFAGKPTGRPIVVELESAVERYPDIAFANDPETALQTAMVRDTLALLTPTVVRQRAQLEIPYLVPGSKMIRRGNAKALAGRWAEAELIWRETLERVPFSSIAVHNLAIAAVARQDFSRARQLAQAAVRMKASRLHQRTMVWVEQTQRAYHEAFQLPDPPEGWSITRKREDN